MYGQMVTRSAARLLLAALLIGGFAFSPTPVEAAKKYVAFAKCPKTGKTGQATKMSLRSARTAAVRRCIANGGLKGCCHVKWVLKPNGKKIRY